MNGWYMHAVQCKMERPHSRQRVALSHFLLHTEWRKLWRPLLSSAATVSSQLQTRPANSSRSPLLSSRTDSPSRPVVSRDYYFTSQASPTTFSESNAAGRRPHMHGCGHKAVGSLMPKCIMRGDVMLRNTYQYATVHMVPVNMAGCLVQAPGTGAQGLYFCPDVH